MAYRTRSSVRRLNSNRRRRKRQVVRSGKPRASASKYVVFTLKPRRKRPTERYFRLRSAAQKAVRRAKAHGFESRMEPITGSWGGGYRPPRIHSNRPMSRRRRSLAAKKGWARRRRSHRRRSRR